MNGDLFVYYALIAASGWMTGTLIVNVSAYVQEDAKLKPSLNTIGLNAAAVVLFFMLACLNAVSQ